MTDNALATVAGRRDLVNVDQVARPASRHPVAVYLGSLSTSSRRTQREALDAVAYIATNGAADAMSCPWSTMRYQHTQAIRSALEDLVATKRYSPATANRMLSALRRVLKECWRLGEMTNEDAARAADLKAIKGDRLPAGRAITPGELRAMLEACGRAPGAIGHRDAALVAVAYSTGCRRDELARLALGDYNPTDASLRALGKGNKERLVYLEAGATAALADWLVLRGDAPGALFCAITKGGRVTLRGLTAQAVYSILLERAQQAGVSDLSPHDFRRTFISDLLDAGEDLATVQRLAGHSSPVTTARYDRRGEEAKKRAVARLSVPYRRRS